ncbi:hypothetical protein ABVT39_018030 [Epinephelus coioides]
MERKHRCTVSHRLKDASPSPVITMHCALLQHHCHPPTETHIEDSFSIIMNKNPPGSA